ncbi:excisionase family DNA-binding protein [Erythrobacteraceae bacterium E2-1 Yellow Sea]|nr:excisionase family DNA-binding protein [Erythrobacteraceae bacterium E2-1 Yellow Sea]
MPTPNEKLADTIPEAAHRLSISRTRIFAELKAGRLQAVRAGGRTLIPRTAQQDWLDALPKVRAEVDIFEP